VRGNIESPPTVVGAFAMPGVYEYLEAERITYAIRIPTNQILQDRIG
jgi:hypothetical protein